MVKIKSGDVKRQRLGGHSGLFDQGKPGKEVTFRQRPG